MPPQPQSHVLAPVHLFLVLRSRAGVGALAGALAPLLAKLKFIYGPHRSLLALHSHKALVQAQVVADGILWKKERDPRQGWGGQSSNELIRPEAEPDLLLSHMSSPRLTTLGAFPATSVYRGTHLPGGRVVSEVGKHASEPMVDFIECPLPLWSLQDGLEVGVRWNEGPVPWVGAEGQPSLGPLSCGSFVIVGQGEGERIG